MSSGERYDTVLVQLISPSTFQAVVPCIGDGRKQDVKGQLLLANLKLVEVGVQFASKQLYISCSSPSDSSTQEKRNDEQDSVFRYVPTVSQLYNEVWDLCLVAKKPTLKCTVLFPSSLSTSPVMGDDPSAGFKFIDVPSLLQRAGVSLIVNAGRNVDPHCLLQEKVKVTTPEKELFEILSGQPYVLFDTVAALPRYDNVVLGGTFDHFHFGHRKLLSIALSICKKRLVVGITNDHMLSTQNKSNRNKIESIDKRKAAVSDFVNLIKGSSGKAGEEGFQLEVHEISDPFGPSIVDAELEAIVVSSETLKGGRMVNVKRKEKGLSELHCVAVLRSSNYTMSSTFLRQFEETGKL